MNKPPTPIGNQIDADLRDSAPSVRIAPRELRTLAVLLTAIPVAAPNLPLAMLRSTAGHIASFLNVPIEQLAIEALVDLAPAFRNYLRERRFKRNSVRSYANFLSILLRTARELGWESPQLEIPDIWKPVLAVMQKHRRPALHRNVLAGVNSAQSPQKNLKAASRDFTDSSQM